MMGNEIEFDLLGHPVHPRARALISDDFFWSSADESAPFGSNEGYYAVYDYFAWRETRGNHDKPFIEYLKFLFAENGLDMTTYLDSSSTPETISEKNSQKSAHDDLSFFRTITPAALCQLVFEGKMDNVTKKIAKTIISKMYDPKFIRQFIIDEKNMHDAHSYKIWLLGIIDAG